MTKPDEKQQKQQFILAQMPAAMLLRHCEQHPQDSLANGILNTRFQKALAVMQSRTHALPTASQTRVTLYVATLYAQPDMEPSREILQNLYAPMLVGNSDTVGQLAAALDEFSVFIKAPNTKKKQQQLQDFLNATLVPGEKLVLSSTARHSTRRHTPLPASKPR